MKTLNKVIEKYEICNGSESYCSECPYNEERCCCDPDALYYLKEYRACGDCSYADSYLRCTQESRNDPLTWDELKQMEGKPVWFEWTGLPRWGIVDGIYTNAFGVENLVICIPHDYLHFDKRMQGQVWQAYRKER